MRCACLLVPLALASACGSQSDTEPEPIPTFPYPLEDTLRVHHIQAKATHNSYHVADPSNGDPGLQFTHTPLDHQLDIGVRGFELDVHFTLDDADATVFRVYHTGVDQKSTCDPLTACLDILRRWSEKHPAHHPIFVQIEPKDAEAPDRIEDYIAKLDAAIRAGIPRQRLLVPDDVKGSAPTLRDAVTAPGGGWPTLRKTRAKFVFYAINDGVFFKAYTRGGTSLDGRAMFHAGRPTDASTAVVLRDDPIASGADIANLVRKGFVVRTLADYDLLEAKANDHTRLDAALASGAHIVATDFPEHVAGFDYVAEVPGGTPSRCNPATAPPDCTPTAIENPEFLARER
jgi:hypothetical protein